MRYHCQLRVLQHWTSRKKYSDRKRMSTPVLEPVTYCTLWSLVQPIARWLQSLQFSVTGSKTGVDILVIPKSNHFESKCKQMKIATSHWWPTFLKNFFPRCFYHLTATMYDLFCTKAYFRCAGNESWLAISDFLQNSSVLDNFTYYHQETPQN